jgi:thiamine biosynthesis protein ThiI
MYKLLLLRYGELGLKGKNKGQFITKLESNIRRALPDKKVISTWGRLWVPLNNDCCTLSGFWPLFRQPRY